MHFLRCSEKNVTVLKLRDLIGDKGQTLCQSSNTVTHAAVSFVKKL
jgi:hypothetical protein